MSVLARISDCYKLVIRPIDTSTSFIISLSYCCETKPSTFPVLPFSANFRIALTVSCFCWGVTEDPMLILHKLLNERKIFSRLWSRRMKSRCLPSKKRISSFFFYSLDSSPLFLSSARLSFEEFFYCDLSCN